MKVKLDCILLIDDDKLVNAMNKTLIDNTECTKNLIKKESAIAALYYLTKSSGKNPFPFPDLILLDIYMPKFSGWDFISFFSKIKGSLARSPIIYLLTANSPGNHITRMGEFTEVAGIHQKPITPAILEFIFDKHFIYSSPLADNMKRPE